MRVNIGDFYFKFTGHGHYKVTYSSQITGKLWSKTIDDMTLIDEFKSTETGNHTQKRLNEFKRLIKN